MPARSFLHYIGVVCFFAGILRVQGDCIMVNFEIRIEKIFLVIN